MTQIATLSYMLGILALYALARDRTARTSPALWLPVAYLCLAASRPVSVWLGGTPEASIDQTLEGSPTDRNVWLCLLLGGFLVVTNRRQKVITLLRANGPLLLFIFYCAVSVLWSDYPEVAFKRWIKALTDLVMLLIVLTDPDPMTAVKRLLSRTSFLLVPLSILFIKYYPDLGRYYSRWEGTQFYGGVTTDKNMLGVSCLVFSLGLLMLVVKELRDEPSRRKRRALVAYSTVLAMALWLLFMINSMTSLSCFVLAGCVMIAATFPALTRRRAPLLHMLAAAAVLLPVCALFVDFGAGLLSTIGRNSTLTGRTSVWKDVLALSDSVVVGSGFESFWLGSRLERMWAIYTFRPNQAHNGYLEVFLNLGLVGLCLLGILIFTGYRNVFLVLHRDAEAGLLRLAYLVAAIIYNLTEGAFKMMHPMWIALLFAVIAVPGGLVRGVAIERGKVFELEERKPRLVSVI